MKMERRETGSAETQASVESPEFGKERETKEDGRYIVFYDFEDEGEDVSGERGEG